MPYFIFAAIVAVLGLAYFRAPIAAWTIAAGLLLWSLSRLADFGVTTNIILTVMFVVLAAVLNVPWLRR